MIGIRSAKDIINKVRAFIPAPGAWFLLRQKSQMLSGSARSPGRRRGTPGEVVGHGECGLIVAGGCGRSLCIGELQMEGFRRMGAYEFTRGRPIPEETSSGMNSSGKSRHELLKKKRSKSRFQPACRRNRKANHNILERSFGITRPLPF